MLLAQVLDAPQEETFEAVTRLAARLADVPASFVSIVDADRDFYLSAQGLSGDIKQTRQLTGRTFCHYTVSSDEPLVIEDTHANPVWQAVPTVQSMGVRAYVGIPLKVDGQRIGSFCVIDTSPRKWQLADIELLRVLAKSVEREIQLRVALEASKAEAAYSLSMARSREFLVSAVVHDIRTPLQVLQLGLAVLKRVQQLQGPPVVERMAAAVNTLNNLASSLLTDTGGIAEHKQLKRKITALELAADAKEMMTSIAESGGVSISLGEFPDAVVEVEYVQILRALGNLIGNSIKYSKPGGQIGITGVRQGPMILIKVSDEGQGMSALELARAFERGFQGGGGMVRGDGAGLGLAIVKQLIERNGGSVCLQSEQGRGTVATISLPCLNIANSPV